MRRWPRADRGRSRARAFRARYSVSHRTTALAAGVPAACKRFFGISQTTFLSCIASPHGDTRSRRDVRMDGMDSRSARTRTRGAGWLCALVVTTCTLLVPGVAHAGIGVSAVPSFPTTATVGDTGARPRRSRCRTATTAPTTARTNYVCNFNSGEPVHRSRHHADPVLRRARATSPRARGPTRASSRSPTRAPACPERPVRAWASPSPRSMRASGRLRFTPVAGQTVAARRAPAPSAASRSRST